MRLNETQHGDRYNSIAEGIHHVYVELSLPLLY